jgi:hypothetical protein
MIGPLLLIVPTLAFWIPIGGPDRHFLYVLVGLAEIVVQFGSRLFTTRRTIALAVLLVVANQGIAEALYAPIVRIYPWRIAVPPGRRAIGTVPLGWSLANHQALARDLIRQREEGRAIARARDPEVVAFLDLAQFTQIAVSEKGPIAWTDTLENGFHALRMDRPGQSFHLIETRWYSPRNVAAEYLRGQIPRGARVYVQPSVRPVAEPDPVIPPEQRLGFDSSH